MKKKFTVLAVLVLAVLLFAAGSRIHGNSALQKAVARYEKEAGPLIPQSYAPAGATPESKEQGDNIAVWLKAGAALVNIGKEKGFLDELMKKEKYNWTAAEKSKVMELLSRNEVALQVLERINKCRNSTFELHYNQGLTMPIPNYLQIVHAGKLLEAKARFHLEERQPAEAMKWVTAQERMAAALRHEPVLIGGMIGIAVEKDYYQTVHALLPHSDPVILKELTQQMQHLKSMTLPASRFLAAEGAAMYHSFTYQSFPGLIESSEETMALPLLHRFFKRQVLANCLEQYADYVNFTKRPYQSVGKNEWTTGGYIKQEIRKRFFPNVSDMVERFQSAEAARILSNKAIELCLQAQKDGGYPASLNSLKSPYTGEESSYSVHSDGSVTLSFAKDDAFWDSTHKKVEPPRKPRFVWNLPAVKAL